MFFARLLQPTSRLTEDWFRLSSHMGFVEGKLPNFSPSIYLCHMRPTLVPQKKKSPRQNRRACTHESWR